MVGRVEDAKLQKCYIRLNIYMGKTLVPYEIPLIAENTRSLLHKVFHSSGKDVCPKFILISD